jgi:hypothetical protein
MATNNGINNSCLTGITVSGGAVSVDSGTSACGISTDASATTLSIGTGNAVKTITVGSTNTTSTTNLTSGSGGVQVATFMGLPATSATNGQIKMNSIPMFHTYGVSNTFAGQSAGNFTTTGTDNVCIGRLNSAALTSGIDNVIIGSQDNGGGGFFGVLSGNYNTAIGKNALNTASGSYNIAIGNGAGYFYTTTDSSNVAINNTGSGFTGESNTLRIGDATGTGVRQLNKSFIHGIYGTTAAGTTSSIPVVTSTGQLSTIAPASSTIGFSTDANTATINLGTGAAVKGVTLGSTNSTSATTVQSGSGALNVTATGGALTVNSGVGALGISTDASATTLSIGTGGAVKTITMGSTNTTSTTNLTSGSGGVQVATFLGLPTTSSTVGQIKVNGTAAFHTYGTDQLFVGAGAGNFTLTGNNNTGIGDLALSALTSASFNTTVGSSAGKSLTSGGQNTAMGLSALFAETTGVQNTSIGYGSMVAANGAVANTTLGYNALNGITTGTFNIAIGQSAGSANTTSDSSNIYIMSLGVAGESNTIRIGYQTGAGASQQNKAFITGVRGITTVNVDALPVLIDSAGQLGTISSSIRFKENVEDMANSSSDILKLRPVTFDLKNRPTSKRQVGLIAEEVYEVMPDLVVHNIDGEIESVKYHDLPALLLNELQKAVKRIEVLEAKLAERD